MIKYRYKSLVQKVVCAAYLFLIWKSEVWCHLS